MPVSFKVGHELRANEADPKLADLVGRLEDVVHFKDRKILYHWIGGTRNDWRGQGHFRALSEEQESWALDAGFDEVVVKTKNKFYDMRGALDSLQYDVIKYEPTPPTTANQRSISAKSSASTSSIVIRALRTVVR